MTKFLKSLFYLPITGLFLYGCSTSEGTVQTYINPSLNSSKITSVAIFPLRNSFVQQNISLGTGDMIEINKMFQMEFAKRNSKTEMVNSVSSTELLNKGNLVNSYDTLLTVYSNTGIPNTRILVRIGNTLKVNAIIQGFVMEVFQNNRNEARITIKYVMFSTTTGEILWEATCVGHRITPTVQATGPISDVIEIIREKIISAMPILSTQ